MWVENLMWRCYVMHSNPKCRPPLELWTESCLALVIMFDLCTKAHLSQPKTTGPPQPEVALPTNPSWMQQWMMGQPNTWMMGQPNPWMMAQQFPPPWMQSQPAPAAPQNKGPNVKPESEARASMRARRKEIEESMDARRAIGQNHRRWRSRHVEV